MFAKSMGELLHNRQHAYTMKKHQKSQDSLYSLIIEMQTLDNNEDHFICVLKLAPEPSVILAYNYHLAKVEAFLYKPRTSLCLG